MKKNYKMYRNLTDEPFLVQNHGNVVLELHYLNNTQFLSENIMKGRFHTWASDGVNYKLFVEKGFYEKVSYFFSEEVNGIWLDYFSESDKYRKRSLPVSLLTSLSPLAIAVAVMFLFPSLIDVVVIAALALSLISNMFFSSKLRKGVEQQHRLAIDKIRDVLTEDGIAKFIKDQDEYRKQYYEENFSSDEDEEIIELAEETLEVLEEEVLEVEAVEVVENVVKDIDYNEMTVAELRDLAKELDLVGYSNLKKADLIEFIKNKGE